MVSLYALKGEGCIQTDHHFKFDQSAFRIYERMQVPKLDVKRNLENISFINLV